MLEKQGGERGGRVKVSPSLANYVLERAGSWKGENPQRSRRSTKRGKEIKKENRGCGLSPWERLATGR